MTAPAHMLPVARRPAVRVLPERPGTGAAVFLCLLLAFVATACGGSQQGFQWAPPSPPPEAPAEGTLPAFSLPEALVDEPIGELLRRSEQAFIDRMQGFIRQTRVDTRMVAAREADPFAASVLTATETVGSRTIEHRIVLLVGTVEHTDVVRLLAAFDFDAPPAGEAEGVRLHIHASGSVPERVLYTLRTHWSGVLERCLHEALIDQPDPELEPLEACFEEVGLALRDEETGALVPARLDLLWNALPGRPVGAVAEGEEAAAPRSPVCAPERGVPCTHIDGAWTFGPYETLRTMGFVLTSWAGERWPALEAADGDDVLASGPALIDPSSGMVFRPGDFPLQAWRAGVASPFRAWIETVSGRLDVEP